jgi:hypothetical protein
MKNKSRCQCFRVSALLFIASGRETIEKLFSLPPADVLSQSGNSPSYSLPAKALAVFTTASPVFRRALPTVS